MSSADVPNQRPSYVRTGSARASPNLLPRPVEYTVFVRLPFPRNDFVDPAPVEWDAVKDKALWKIISKGSDSRDLDWEDIANRFDVSLQFLMKQAAWLYERHFAGVRKQMQRLATTSTPIPGSRAQDLEGSKLPPLNTNTSLLKRAGSKSSHHAPSPRSRDSPVPDEGPSPRPSAPPFSRTPSTATITQSKLFTSSRGIAQRPLRTSARIPISPRQRDIELSDNTDNQTQPLSVEDSGSDDEHLLSQSRAFRRPALSSKPTLGGLSSEGDAEDDDEDDEDESSSAGFLPFATSRQDPSATLRGQPPPVAKLKARRTAASSSASSSSSMPPPLSSTSNSKELLSGPKPGPLSPKHRAQLKQLSPRGTNKDVGSDGTPSMGSSFSDLDDAGISASAIEDAVLSTMQAGGGSIASRVSGLSQAFRSQK